MPSFLKFSVLTSDSLSKGRELGQLFFQQFATWSQSFMYIYLVLPIALNPGDMIIIYVQFCQSSL